MLVRRPLSVPVILLFVPDPVLPIAKLFILTRTDNVTPHVRLIWEASVHRGRDGDHVAAVGRKIIVTTESTTR